MLGISFLREVFISAVFLGWAAFSAARRAAPDIGPGKLGFLGPALAGLVLLFFQGLNPEDTGHLGGCRPIRRMEPN